MSGVKETENAFPPLETVCKKQFAFPVACPSFVYRAGYMENVRRLAPFVDEIQLLFFESRSADSRPSRSLIQELVRLGREGDITYNVHLPSDIHPGHRDIDERRRAAAVLTDLMARCDPLNPTTFTLHLNRDASEVNDARWLEDTVGTLKAVLSGGASGRRISVENTDYDFDLAAPVVEELDLSVCMDMGHLMARGKALAPFFDRWQDRITIVHLHGVAGTADHLPLDRLSPAHMSAVLTLLNRFSGVVSLEVYSVDALNASIAHLMREGDGLKAKD